MPDYKSTLDELVAAREQAREVLRELHGVMKDCKRAKAEVVALLQRGTAMMVLEALNEELDKAVKSVSIHLTHVIDEASKQVLARFTEVAKQLEVHEESLRTREQIVQETAEIVTNWLERQKERGYE